MARHATASIECFSFFVAVFCLVSAGLIGPLPLFAQKEDVLSRSDDGGIAATWTETDTRLANHYISLLQKDPAYGKVFDLLWDLYAKKNQLPLLVEYFRGAAEADQPRGGIASLLYAHLLRKSEEIDSARQWYGDVLDHDNNSVAALKALAEISDQQKRSAKALSFYTRLIPHVPVGTEDGVAVRMRKASLHRQLDQLPEAVRSWEEILNAYPSHSALRTEIVGMLLEAGETRIAIRVLEDLTRQDDPRQRLNALLELNRLYDFISDFENAISSARTGMRLVHFRDHQHDELFSRLVRSHERFDRLDVLEKDLALEAERENPSEKDLYLLVEFYRLTANPAGEEKAMAELVQRLPQNLDYRVRLAEIQMENDHYEAAAATLDQVLDQQEEVPLRLILLRARVALNDEDPSIAEHALRRYLKMHPEDSDSHARIVEFARAHYLDELVEEMLRQRGGAISSDGESAPLELARFLQERGRKTQAQDTLWSYADAAGDAITERARRLHQIATSFREIDLADEAEKAIDQAIELVPDQPSYLQTKADLLVDEKKIEEAVVILEKVMTLHSDLSDKTDVDQKIFTLMRGHFTKDKVDPDANILNSGNIQSLSEYRRLAAAVNARNNRESEQGPPKEVMDYFANLKRSANANPSPEARYRAAWWAFRLQETRDCFLHLSAAKTESTEPLVEVEKMLLELAEQQERPALMANHLETLAEIDPENEEEYKQKRAFVRFQLGWEDEAIRELQSLASQPDASLNTLNTLAKVYQMQGSTTRHIEVWRAAFRKANVFEKRRIIKQLANALLEANQPEEALKAQLDLIVKETDPVQRRKQLDAQLSAAKSHNRLKWLQERYQELAQREPFDRFFPEALARVFQADNNDQEAFAAMKKAYYLSGQRDELLDELGALAGKLGDLKSAIYYRRQVIARAEGETTIESWESLIEMLEKDLRVGEADLLRRRLESKFGQDPEFLSRMAASYRRNHQFESARRILARLVKLRSWDLSATLELGILQAEAGDDEGALKLFEKIIAQTEGESLPAKYSEHRLWPLLRVPGPGSEILADDYLREFAITIEAFPSTGNSHRNAEIQESISDWLQESHPEFDLLPKEKYFQRLRAIEEAASLSARLSGKVQSDWWRRWEQAAEASFVEKLWALRHAGAKSATLQLIKTEAVSEGSEMDVEENYLWLSYLRLLSGDRDPESSLVQVEKSDPLPIEQTRRDYFCRLAAFLWIKDRAAGEVFADATGALRWIGEHDLPTDQGTQMFSELRREGKWEPAFEIGRVMVEQETLKRGSSLFYISQVAGWAGDIQQRTQMLDRAIQEMISDRAVETPSQLFPALRERLSLFETDEARLRYIYNPGILSATKNQSDSTRQEKKMILHLAGNQQDKAIPILRSLAHEIGTKAEHQRVTIASFTAKPRIRKGPNWSEMSSLLRRGMGLFRLREPESIAAFVEAAGGGIIPYSVDEHSLFEQELFQIEKFVWQLEGRTFAERSQLVAEFFGRLSHEDSPSEFARIMRARGFHRETAQVLRAEAITKPDQYEPMKEFFEACHDALDPETALRMLDQLENREVTIPPGLSSDYIDRQRALFLFHQRDFERLRNLSQVPDPAPGAPPIRSASHIPYQQALIQGYLQNGEHNDQLIAVLDAARSRGELEKEYLLLGAQLYAERKDATKARDWLDAISFDGRDSAIEEEAIDELIRLMQENDDSHPQQRDDLLEFARNSLENQKPETTIRLAQALSKTGFYKEAEGILRLLNRKVSNSVTRGKIVFALLETQLQSGQDWSDIEQDLDAFFVGVREDKLRMNSELVRLFVANPPQDLEGLDSFFARHTSIPRTAWLSRLLRAFLSDTLPEEARLLLRDPKLPQKKREQILQVLLAFGESGKQIASSIVEESRLPGTDFFRGHPSEQISFFAAIRDLTRLQEIHASLVDESQSSSFYLGGQESFYPTLRSRMNLPKELATLGYPEMGESLIEAYYQGIRSEEWEYPYFLQGYVEFLIEREQFSKAEQVFRRNTGRSSFLDLRALVWLYQKWGKLDEWQQRTQVMDLSLGQQNLIREWIKALAMDREMIHYRH